MNPRRVAGAQEPSIDEWMMRRALQLAVRGQGLVEPNPMVGCVIARGEKIIGEGFHRRFGGPHAEVEALKACRSSTQGATAYVTLEPCAHHGKTPPCVDALIAAGIRHVVFPFRDPNASVNGRGERLLRRDGVGVRRGLLKTEAARVLAPFLTVQKLKRPYVIAKWAQSLDGKLATASGDSKWISGELARQEVHRLRARMDAIMVGAGTVLTDAPRLTARNAPIRRIPCRVVMDSRLRVPLDVEPIRSASRVPTLVFTTPSMASSSRARRLNASCGAEVLACPSDRGGLILTEALSTLAQRGVTNLLVEGGPKLLAAFLKAKLIDEAWVYIAPIWIGQGPSIEIPNPAAQMKSAFRSQCESAVRIGADIRYKFRFNNPLRLIG